MIVDARRLPRQSPAIYQPYLWAGCARISWAPYNGGTMFRWLCAFFLFAALLGSGLAVQASQAWSGVGPDATAFLAESMAVEASPAEPADPTPGAKELVGTQAEGETVVDVPLLLDSAPSPSRRFVSTAAPLRFGWAPMAPPFIEGLQRPPRQTQALA